MDWEVYRRADTTLDIVAAWADTITDDLEPIEHEAAEMFLRRIEERSPIRSRQAASIAVAAANHSIMLMRLFVDRA